MAKGMSVEDNGEHQGQNTNPYISSTGLLSSPLSLSDLTRAPTCPSNP